MKRLCANPWNTAYISGNGDVTYCCFSNYGPVGNIKRQSLEAVWRSSAIGKVRNALARGRFIEAGCDESCRIYRWYQFYGAAEGRPALPKGQGRLEDFADENPILPRLIGLEIDGRCNLRCTHCCKTPGPLKGMEPGDLDALWPAIAGASMVRFRGGEFSINEQAYAILDRIASLRKQPTVFLNTNGQTSLNRYLDHVENLRSFHLKFSLEGIGPGYERVRAGGSWERFDAHVREAKRVADKKRSEGKDWQVLFNYCAMRSNFRCIPEAVAYAAKLNISILINTIVGVKNTTENMFVYGHLKPDESEIESTINAIDAELASANSYSFTNEVSINARYIMDVLRMPKISLSQKSIETIRRRVGPKNADRLLFMLYKFDCDKRSLMFYLFRGFQKRLARLIRH